tara:strand:+ start:25522 stop:26199 length:678 start_codon:yes stop_codon:yes gene_type:complete
VTKNKIVHVKLYEDLLKDGEWQIRTHRTTEEGLYERCVTLSGQRWESLLKRCSSSGSEQIKHPRYEGVTNKFRDFQDFVNWSRMEVGYEQRELVGGKSWAWSLDKDILGGDSKVYSPDTCIFVPININTFLTARNTLRGEYPIGVSWKDKNQKFQARVRGNGTSLYLGLYETAEEAHRAWQVGKVSVGRELAKSFEDCHPKLYEGLNRWLDKIQEDHASYRETKL